MLYPVLAAVTVALAEGCTLDAAVASLEPLAPTPDRLETVPLPNGTFLLYDHYKSGLETVDAALDVLAEIPARRKIVVLGDVDDPPGRTMEEVDAMYERLGARIASIATRAIVVHLDIGGPRPDYEAGALDGGLAPDALVRAATVPEAFEALAADLRPGDVVLIKGATQQRFDRIALAFAGRDVRCALTCCMANVSCAACPMLERGWDATTEEDKDVGHVDSSRHP
jgi:UDP-N-acetylmuramoyl-tripeptide--D-alanyl-D-alanine ligase